MTSEPHSTGDIEARLDGISRTFHGVLRAVAQGATGEGLASVLDPLEPELRGIGFEAAAMGVASLDLQEASVSELPRWRHLLEQEGTRYGVLLHVGLGSALAQLRRPWEPYLDRLHPLYRWRLVDGYGFYLGYFAREGASATATSKPGLRTLHQGLGRGLWYLARGSLEELGRLISGFSAAHHSELWIGIGIASTYVGGLDPEALERLLQAAGSFRPELAVGAVLAARTRRAGGALGASTEQACRCWAGRTATELTRLSDRLLREALAADPMSLYHSWIRLLVARMEEVED